jgi:hypothetical protein
MSRLISDLSPETYVLNPNTPVGLAKGLEIANNCEWQIAILGSAWGPETPEFSCPASRAARILAMHRLV